MRPNFSNPISKEEFLDLPDGTLLRKETFAHFILNDESRGEVDALFQMNWRGWNIGPRVVVIASAEKVIMSETLYKASDIPADGSYYIALLTQDGAFEKQVSLHNCQSRIFAPYGFKAIFCNPMGGPSLSTKYVPQLEL